jgi:hypothetical protein
MSTLEGMCVVNDCACLFTPCNFETNNPIFIKIDFNMSYFAMVHFQSSRHDTENLQSSPSTQLYHFPWTVPTLKFDTPVRQDARSALSATGCMANCYQPDGTTGLVYITWLSRHGKMKTLPLIACQYVLIPV